MQFSKQLPVANLEAHTLVELGSIEGTIWSCFVAYYFNSRLRINIFRSRSDNAVTIDVKVLSSEHTDILFTNGNLLSNGLNQIYLNFNGILSTGLSGYVTVHYNSSKKEEVTQTSNDIISSPQLGNDLLHLLDNPDSFSDATLVCGTLKIPVHRGILAARSPVFADMFSAGRSATSTVFAAILVMMREGREGVVDIVDMEPDVLQAMLRYVYSGKTDHLTDSLAGDLLFAADEYQLEELKLICVQRLKANMAADNVFRSLALGDLYDEGLKKYAAEFICNCKSFSDLENSAEWKSLLKENSCLALEVLTTAVTYLQKKGGCDEDTPIMD